MTPNSMWIEGLSDAVGFVGGALLGFWMGRLLGWDIFAAGYGNATIGGILLVGLGGGTGLQLARQWRRQKLDKQGTTQDASSKKKKR